MAAEAASTAKQAPWFDPPERSFPVASLLSLSGGFLDAFTWLLLGGVFANSQTGNVVFFGVYTALGKWHEAAYHLFPIAGFLVGAWIGTRVRAPLSCLAGEIILLAAVMALLPFGLSKTIAIIGLSTGVALQTVSFRHVERWSYLSVTVTGNMLRGIEQIGLRSDPAAARGEKIMLTICVMFLLGAAAGGWMTTHLKEFGLVAPIMVQISALSFCGWRRRRNSPL
jgi:uncharacterized membrane protein YoaK (UPF0700 family)